MLPPNQKCILPAGILSFNRIQLSLGLLRPSLWRVLLANRGCLSVGESLSPWSRCLCSQSPGSRPRPWERRVRGDLRMEVLFPPSPGTSWCSRWTRLRSSLKKWNWSQEPPSPGIHFLHWWRNWKETFWPLRDVLGCLWKKWKRHGFCEILWTLRGQMLMRRSSPKEVDAPSRQRRMTKDFVDVILSPCLALDQSMAKACHPVGQVASSDHPTHFPTPRDPPGLHRYQCCSPRSFEGFLLGLGYPFPPCPIVSAPDATHAAENPIPRSPLSPCLTTPKTWKS